MAKKLNENDKLILKTKEQIEISLQKIKETEKGFIKKTNFILEWNNNTFNLNVIPQEQIAILMWQLTSYKEFLINKNLPLKIKYSQDYTIDDWLHDLEKQHLKKNLSAEKTRLSNLQKLLESKLTEETKTSLELENLISQININ